MDGLQVQQNNDLSQLVYRTLAASYTQKQGQFLLDILTSYLQVIPAWRNVAKHVCIDTGSFLNPNLGIL